MPEYLCYSTKDMKEWKMAVVDFLGKTWFIYHNGSLPHGSGFRRVACVEEVKFYDACSLGYCNV